MEKFNWEEARKWLMGKGLSEKRAEYELKRSARLDAEQGVKTEFTPESLAYLVPTEQQKKRAEEIRKWHKEHEIVRLLTTPEEDFSV